MFNFCICSHLYQKVYNKIEAKKKMVYRVSIKEKNILAC